MCFLVLADKNYQKIRANQKQFSFNQSLIRNPLFISEIDIIIDNKNRLHIPMKLSLLEEMRYSLNNIIFVIFIIIYSFSSICIVSFLLFLLFLITFNYFVIFLFFYCTLILYYLLLLILFIMYYISFIIFDFYIFEVLRGFALELK